ncbi:DUF885 domain-containing protein [Actinomyces sp. 2119]|uniref:DUF885 domain-containing protein n=1 Tax=Actinomyces sp. 2119 TaxID=2321393 RepID=UPI000E6C852E|nr:DUF885 domain-containing protein [Actinomyces sp. 2119]RJF43754.1 DUF885 domain-containing protein [Actinomyces sp. 2119]
MRDVPPRFVPGRLPVPQTAGADLRDLAEQYSRVLAAHDPEIAARTGLLGQTALPDYSPDALADHVRATRSLRARVEKVSGEMAEVDSRLREHLLERMETDADLIDSGEGGAYLGFPESPFQRVLRLLRSPAGARDLGPAGDEADAAEGDSRWESDWQLLSARLEMLPQTLAGLRASLEDSAARGVVSPASQVEFVAGQARDFADRPPLAPAGGLPSSLTGEVERADRVARQACLDFAEYLISTLGPQAPLAEGVGPQRHQLWMRRHLGTRVDPAQTFAWAQEELRLVAAEQDRLAAEVLGPGADYAAMNIHLRSDPALGLSPQEYLPWAQSVVDQAWDVVVGKVLDLPQGLGRPRVVLDRFGRQGHAGDPCHYEEPYGTGGVHPGTVVRSLAKGEEVLWPWVERTTMLHESVPGHHVHSGGHTADMRLTLWQRYLGRVPGCNEGWALYAESLGEELGLVEEPQDRFGLLAARRWRLARVLVDLGVHSRLPVPPEVLALPGADTVWSRATVMAVLRAHTIFPEEFLRFETSRRLGWPAQSLSHVLGERVWRAGRRAAEARVRSQGGRWGPGQMRSFHNRAISLGSVGLGLLERELS